MAVALLMLKAHSGIHAGAGQEVGTVDLPIQRERVTNFPVVRSSSLKGALRQAATEKKMPDIDAVFGPEKCDHAGAVSVGDARLLLFPMRSLKGTFALVTCPFVLERLKRDLDDSGLGASLTSLPTLAHNSDTALIHQTGSRVSVQTPASGGQAAPAMVVLEEYGFKAQPAKAVDDLAVDLIKLGLTCTKTELAGKLGKVGDPLEKAWMELKNTAEAELAGRLVIVGDDHFQNFTSFCTEILTRVHLDDTTKTVLKSQLWTEELLPAESVLASLLIAAEQRGDVKTGTRQTGDQMLNSLRKNVAGRFQIGGNETVGYGICHAGWRQPADFPPAKKGG